MDINSGDKITQKILLKNLFLSLTKCSKKTKQMLKQERW